MWFKIFSEIFALAITIAVFGLIFIIKNRNRENEFFQCSQCGGEFRWYIGFAGHCPYCGKICEANNSTKEEE